MTIKQLSLRIFFYTEIIVLGWFYLFDEQSISQFKQFEIKKTSLQEEVLGLKHEVDALKQEINQWEQYSYHQEKLAREKLQMALPDEKVYYIEP